MFKLMLILCSSFMFKLFPKIKKNVSYCCTVYSISVNNHCFTRNKKCTFKDIYRLNLRQIANFHAKQAKSLNLSHEKIIMKQYEIPYT